MPGLEINHLHPLHPFNHEISVKGRDGAAELLGVNPTTFLARMKKWNITRPAGS